MTSTTYVDVVSCARCGEDHTHVEFKDFTNPVVLTVGDKERTMGAWGTCPRLNEPILLEVVKLH